VGWQTYKRAVLKSKIEEKNAKKNFPEKLINKRKRNKKNLKSYILDKKIPKNSGKETGERNGSCAQVVSRGGGGLWYSK